MALRQFIDSTGRRWQVWETRPSSRVLSSVWRERGGQVPTPGAGYPILNGWEGGWLTFESGGEKRRLSPIPDDWEGASEDRLARWLKKATLVGRTGDELAADSRTDDVSAGAD